MAALLPLIAAVTALVVAAALAPVRPALVPRIALAGAAVTGVAAGVGWASGGGSAVLWSVPAWGLAFRVELDGLGATYAFVAAGIGVAVLAFSQPYMATHASEHGMGAGAVARFYVVMLLFLASMVGLATAGDLLGLFIFFELTTLASYLLIGFDRTPRARAAALTALLVTSITSLGLLLGALQLEARYGTFRIDELAERAGTGSAPVAPLVLIAVAALAKSAQAPLHLWLPRAMVAPTPVSAYLHSAAMVAAGVFVLHRLFPLFAGSGVRDGLLGVGLASVVVGSCGALTVDGLKRLLAYSTIAQYGYVVALLALGTPHAAAAGAFYIVAHGVAKAGLFMVAGAVTQATGAERLSEASGLARAMPGLAASAGALAAALAGLPATVGFFKDDLLFGAALDRGPWLTAAFVAGAGATVAYSWRFWSGVFLGPETAGAQRRRPHARLVAAPALLGAVAVAGGLVPGPLGHLSGEAAAVAGHRPPIDVGYHLTLRPETVAALCAYAAGAVLVLLQPTVDRLASAVAAPVRVLSPTHLVDRGAAFTFRASATVARFELQSLRDRIVAVVVPAALLVGLGLVAGGVPRARPGTLGWDDAPLALLLAGAGAVAVVATFLPRLLAMSIAVSAVGYALALAYGVLAGPGVALTAVLVGTAFTLLLLGVLARLPAELVRRFERGRARSARRNAVGALATLFMFLVALATLSEPAEDTVARDLVRYSKQQGAGNVVNRILVDFRGLDTVGETTVLAVTLLGIAGLLAVLRRQR